MKKIPTTVVTGFLGAGKTTLIRHLLDNADGRRIALIINEFGDLGVDGDLLKGCGDETCSDDDIFELSNGCICCTVAEDFIPTMEALLARPDAPDHIVIETSGLALPQPLVRAFQWPQIATRVTVDGVVTVVDGKAVAEGRFAANLAAVEAQRRADDNLDHETPLSELFEDQIAAADMIVVNKTDLLGESEADDLVAKLTAEARPGVHVVRTSMGQLPGEVHPARAVRGLPRCGVIAVHGKAAGVMRNARLRSMRETGPRGIETEPRARLLVLARLGSGLQPGEELGLGLGLAVGVLRGATRIMLDVAGGFPGHLRRSCCLVIHRSRLSSMRCAAKAHAPTRRGAQASPAFSRGTARSRQSGGHA
jgi:Ni2+-binding GTPase involved in maturation of urease and hydrogenase